VTTAERAPTVEEILAQSPPGTPPPPPEVLVPGALVLDATMANGWWWKWMPGASWRKPDGEHELTPEHDNHPVVQVSWDDAQAYAKWAKKRLPTEAEWERAARGGVERQRYVWGTERNPQGKELANIWQGRFPEKNTVADGFEGTAPVGSFPANGFGLLDMAGNVWEWDRGLVPARRILEDAGGRARSAGTRRQLRSAGTRRGEARHARWFVPVQRQLLHRLPAERAHEVEPGHGALPHRLPLRARPVNPRGGRA
jgi:formylglycine-generating enzyme required for sulfatase activity